MSRVIQHPEIKQGHLRAVAYSQVDVSIYDDAVDAEREVAHVGTLDEAREFMDEVGPYLAAFKSHEIAPSDETKARLRDTFAAIEKSEWQSRALTIAFRRYES